MRWTRRRNFAGRSAGWAVLLLALSPPAAALAVTIGGVEFTDWTAIEATPGTNLELTTDGDVFVYAPGAIYYDALTLTSFENVFVSADLNVNDPPLCAGGCATDVYDLSGDVAISISGPMGALTLTTPSSAIVFDTTPIPEPSSAPCLVSGLALLALGRRGPRRVLRRAR